MRIFLKSKYYIYVNYQNYFKSMLQKKEIADFRSKLIINCFRLSKYLQFYQLLWKFLVKEDAAEQLRNNNKIL